MRHAKARSFRHRAPSDATNSCGALSGTPKAAAPPEPDQPALNLVGTIFGRGEGYAGFLDTATHGIVRPKTSKGEHGWILRSVTDREAVLEKNYRTVVVRLPTITGDRQ